MDVDPLADTVPPRYALESDEEEDEFNPLQIKKDSDEGSTTFEIKIIGQIEASKPLIVAFEDAGRIWAKGADLGEQTGAVAVNGVQIGFIFNPTWTKATIIVSESFSRLPLTCMHPFAQAVLEALKPRSFALLDTYPLPSYLSKARSSFYDAPLRYLTTSESVESLEKESVQPFAPPNLIQSTSASFLALASLPQSTPDSNTLLLLPSPRIPSSRPKSIIKNEFPSPGQDRDEDFEWSNELLAKTHRVLLEAVGESAVGSKAVWKLSENTSGVAREKGSKRNIHLGDSGMYI